MTNNNLYLPGFHLATLRRKIRFACQKLTDELARIRRHSISQLGENFTRFIPKQFPHPEKPGKLSRRRLFSKENIFWGFFSQVLNTESGCAEVVRKFHAFSTSMTYQNLLIEALILLLHSPVESCYDISCGQNIRRR